MQLVFRPSKAEQHHDIIYEKVQIKAEVATRRVLPGSPQDTNAELSFCTADR